MNVPGAFFDELTYNEEDIIQQEKQSGVQRRVLLWAVLLLAVWHLM
jgi:hypothetical protein